MFQSSSQASQDIFVHTFSPLQTFVEIGSNHPIITNNTYSLESNYGWSGIMVEYDASFEPLYKELRSPKTTYYIGDAQTAPYRNMFVSKFTSKNIGYLQLDLDVNNRSTLNTLELLDRTCFDDYTFATVTFEHDIYTGDYFDTRAQSRAIFEKRGYIRMYSDVCVFFDGDWRQFEDWYVHPSLVDAGKIAIYKQPNNSEMHHTDMLFLL